MTEKRFTDIGCSETGHIGVTDYGIDKEFTSDEFEEFLNELNDENDILKQQLQTKHIVNKQYEELQRLKEENEKLRFLIDINSVSERRKLERQFDEQQSLINEQNEAIEYLKTVIRYTIPNQMVADVFKYIGEDYE